MVPISDPIRHRSAAIVPGRSGRRTAVFVQNDQRGRIVHGARIQWPRCEAVAQPRRSAASASVGWVKRRLRRLALAVSRRGIPDLLVADSRSQAFWSRLAESWAAFDGAAVGISNLGRRQDVRLLHVHLLPQRPAWAAGTSAAVGESIAKVIQSLQMSESPSLQGCTASIAIARDGVGDWRAWVDLAG